MGYRAWFTRVSREGLSDFKDAIRRNPNALGIYYTIDIAADIKAFRKGLWVAWAGDGDGSLTRDMPTKYTEETLFLDDDVLPVYPDWRDDPGWYGRVDHHVLAGGLSLAEGRKGGKKYLEDWFVTAEEEDKIIDAKSDNEGGTRC